MRKYLRQCKQLFPIYRKQERLFFRNLKEQVFNYTQEHPNYTYEALVQHFGSPTEIIVSYYNTVGVDTLMKNLNITRVLKRFLGALFLVVFTFFIYQTIIIWQCYLDNKNSIIIHEDSTIEYLYPEK